MSEISSKTSMGPRWHTHWYISINFWNQFASSGCTPRRCVCSQIVPNLGVLHDLHSWDSICCCYLCVYPGWSALYQPYTGAVLWMYLPGDNIMVLCIFLQHVDKFYWFTSAIQALTYTFNLVKMCEKKFVICISNLLQRLFEYTSALAWVDW